MNKLIILGLAATMGAAYTAMQGTSVELQPTSPGTAQSGHLNITGTATVGILKSQNTVFGQSTAATGYAYGGYFTAASNQARGFYGYASSPTGLTYGGFFQNASESGRAVYGLATATTGFNFGGYFQTASTGGRGLLGVAAAPTGTTYGVYGTAVSPTGFGVYSDGNMHSTGVISGNGSGLSNVDASKLGGFSSASYLRSIPVPLVLNGSVPAGGVIVGENISTAYNSPGVLGKSAQEISAGVQGISTANQGYGIHGESNGIYGIGVLGEATSTTGGGLSIPTGGFFRSSSITGRGVYGHASSSTGVNFGGYFRSSSATGTGTYGEATADSGVNYGVQGSSESTAGRGVFGQAKAVSGTNYGVFGMSQSPSGRGVYGSVSSATGAPYGVLGFANTTGFAVFAIGDMGASGTKPFRIDHPFDPENKYLLHYAAESPMPQNFYVGNVVTDAHGYAWVDLPDYFSEINTNFKYQLTVISGGADFVQSMISKEIHSNRFQIRTSAPNIKVSWEIKADRNDLYVRRKHPKEVVEKEGSEKGTYQNPELYGLGSERGINHDTARLEQRNQPPSNANKKSRQRN